MFDLSNVKFRHVLPLIAIAASLSLFSQSAGFSQSSPTASPTPKPSASPAPTSTRNESLAQLLQQASSAGSFTTLAQALKASGASGALQGRGKFTIFAPTDAAFAALPAGTLEKLLKPANRPILARILAYHVVPGQYTSKQLPNGNLGTLAGGISLDVSSQRVIVNDAKVVQADILASNGVIHAVDRVLLPRSLRAQLQALK